MGYKVSGGHMMTNQQSKENVTESLKHAFNSFINDIDSRNVISLEHKFHDQFLDHVSIGGYTELLVSNKDKYIQSLTEGKIGGIPRKIQINSLEFIDNFGIVKADLESNVMRFQTQYSFLWQDGDWKVIHALVVANKI